MHKTKEQIEVLILFRLVDLGQDFNKIGCCTYVYIYLHVHVFCIVFSQDRFLPIANVARIMKKSIPKTGKVSRKFSDFTISIEKISYLRLLLDN